MKSERTYDLEHALFSETMLQTLMSSQFMAMRQGRGREGGEETVVRMGAAEVKAYSVTALIPGSVQYHITNLYRHT